MFQKAGWLILGVTLLVGTTACKNDPYGKLPDTTSTPSTRGTGLSTSVPGSSEPTVRTTTPKERAIPVARSSETGVDDTNLLLQPVKVRDLPSVFGKKEKQAKKKKKAELSFGVGGLQMDPSMKNMMGQPSGSLLGGSLTLSTGSSGSMQFNDDDDDKAPTSKVNPSSLPTTRVVVPTSQPAIQPQPRVAVIPVQPTTQPAQPSKTRPSVPPPSRRLVRVTAPPTRMGMPGLKMAGDDDNADQKIPAILAKVNDEPADRWSFYQLMKEMKRLLAFQQGGMPVGALAEKLLRKQALKRVIDHILLHQKALQDGIQLTPRDEKEGLRLFFSRFPKRISLDDYLNQEKLTRKDFMERLRRQLIVRKYMMKLTREMPFTKQQVRAFYNKHYNSATVRARQIVIPIVKKDVEAAKALALHVLKLAKKPDANFVALVQKYSHDSSKELNGDIGELKKGDLLPALENVLFALRKNQVGGPVQTDLGFHILKVVQRKEPTPYGRVQVKIIKRIQMKKLEKVLKKQLAELRSEGQVEILVPWGKD